MAIFIESMSPSVNEQRKKLLALPGILLGRLLSGLAFWAPVALATGFLALVALNGLRPALTEKRRLAEKSAQMNAVNEKLLLDEAALDQELKAQNDPIYLERLRRLDFQRDIAAPMASRENRFLSHVEVQTQ
jgi:hypothetical protein